MTESERPELVVLGDFSITLHAPADLSGDAAEALVDDVREQLRACVASLEQQIQPRVRSARVTVD